MGGGSTSRDCPLLLDTDLVVTLIRFIVRRTFLPLSFTNLDRSTDSNSLETDVRESLLAKCY